MGTAQKQLQKATDVDAMNPVRFSDFIIQNDNLSINPFYSLNTAGLTSMASVASLYFAEAGIVDINPESGSILSSSSANDIAAAVVADSIFQDSSSVIGILQNYADRHYISVVRFGGLKLPNLSSYVGYLVVALRNPILDFSYAPLKSAHYNTLDKL